MSAKRPRNVASALAVALIAASCTLLAASDHTWPSPRYREDPIAFCREVLGVEPWAAQVAVLEALRDFKRVAVASGHKCGKSTTAIIAALWFYCSFDDARVILTATTSRQVDAILWRELKKIRRRALVPIQGEIGELARTGLKATDFREIVGFTAREAEGVAGISGKNILYIPDEASGIGDDIFEAIEGNRAAGGDGTRLLMISNPTRTEGEFFEAFHSKAEFYKTIQISSETTPNVIEGREVIPGLAGRDWIEEKRREWGVDSPLYKVRVKGEFVIAEEGKILSLHAIGEAEKRWASTPASGRLYIGVDPAGPGEGGDETAIAVRRGQKIIALYAHRGQSEDAVLVHVLAAIAEHRLERDEPPVVVVDKQGPIGGSIYGRLRAIEDRERLVVAGVQASDRACRQPHIYDRVRDELWANLAQWLREGGAIPEDTKLAKELHAPEWSTIITGRLKASPKDVLRKLLGRSPDRGDAVALAVWTPLAVREEEPEPEAEPDDGAPDYGGAIDRTFDPYRGVS